MNIIVSTLLFKPTKHSLSFSFAASSHILEFSKLYQMATSAAVVIPAFTGLKATAKPATVKLVAVAPTATAPRMTVKASLKNVGAAVIATAAAAGILAGNAMAMEVDLGTVNGELVFIPKEFSVASGEEIVFKNVGGYPHNVVFDEDNIPAGVDPAKISMDESDFLNGPGELYKVTLTEKGTYSFYCAPHASSGMVGQVTVN